MPQQFAEAEKKRSSRETYPWLNNLRRFWDLRHALTGSRRRWLPEYLVEVLAERADEALWKKCLEEAHRRVDLYLEDEKPPR